MIKTNQDLYKTTETLISELKVCGEKVWADKLEDALKISSVPGEILGELRFQVRELQKMKSKTRENVRINEMLSYLDAIL